MIFFLYADSVRVVSSSSASGQSQTTFTLVAFLKPNFS